MTNIDKIAHVCMYGGLELILWIEYLRHHTNIDKTKFFLFGIIFPIALGGLMELAQIYLTQKRSGEWADIIADTIGVMAGATLGYLVIRTICRKK